MEVVTGLLIILVAWQRVWPAFWGARCGRCCDDVPSHFSVGEHNEKGGIEFFGLPTSDIIQNTTFLVTAIEH
jgi:hypothetical protein